MTSLVPEELTTPSSTDLAVDRTVLALDRTQMAWIRTALSGLTFGFSIVKFFEYLRQERVAHAPPDHAPRFMGIAIMSVGLIALGMATWQYVRDRRRLGSPPGLSSPALLVALVLLVIQALALAWAFAGR
jgi:putative membrane protein